MKRSNYRGEHKGSTVKARSKTYATRALNSMLAFVLVVGLAPSMSFAGQETVTVRTDDGELTEQVVVQEAPVLEEVAPVAEEQVVIEENTLAETPATSGSSVVYALQKDLAKTSVDAAKSVSETGIMRGTAAEGENDAEITVTLDGSFVNQTLDADANYFNESLTVKATVTDTDLDGSKSKLEIKRGDTVLETKEITASGSEVLATISADKAGTESFTVVVTAVDTQATPATKTYTVGAGADTNGTLTVSDNFNADKPIKINAKPTVSVSWALKEDSKGVIDGTKALFPDGSAAATEGVVATITVSDATLLPELAGTPASGTESQGITLTASGTETAASFSPWSGSAGSYSCTATFSYEDAKTATIAASVKDSGDLSADGPSNTTMAMALDSAKPTVTITPPTTEPTPHKTIDSKEWYGAARTITVKIEDENGLDLSGMQVLAAGAETPTVNTDTTTSPYTFTVTYSQNSIDEDCTLVVSGVKDKAGNPTEQTEYTLAPFRMLTTPIVGITSSTAPANTKDSKAVYGGSVVANLSVKTLAWPTTTSGLVTLLDGNGNSAAADLTVDTWTAASDYEHTATATVSNAGSYNALQINTDTTVTPSIPETKFEPAQGINAFVIDKTPPELKVEWAPDATAETVGSKEYFGKTRTATITISDDQGFTEDQWKAIKGKITATNGTLAENPESETVSNTKYVIKATFTGNEDNCNLAIANITDAANNDMTGASGTTVDGTAHTYKYSDDGFAMLTVPQLTVTRNPANGAEKDGKTYYTDPLAVTLGLHALPSQIADIQLTAKDASPSLEEKTGADAWGTVQTGGLDYSRALSFAESNTAYANAITVAGLNSLTFIPPTSNSVDDAVQTYTFTPATFVVDGVGPVLSMTWSDAVKVTGTGLAEKRYYNADKTPSLSAGTLTEANPLSMGNVVVNFGEGAVDVSTITPSLGVYTLSAPAFSNEGTYEVTVGGNGGVNADAARDLAGNLMTGAAGTTVVSGKYKTTIVVDKQPPTITAQYVDANGEAINVVDKDGNDVSAEFNTTGGTFYYKGEAAKLRVFVDDANFDSESAKINDAVPSDGWKPVSVDEDNTKYYADVDVATAADPASGNEKVTDVTVSATDLAQNPATFTVKSIADKKDPTVDVKYYVGYGSAEQKEISPKEAAYYSDEKVTAVITVTETYFDKRADKTVVTTTGTLKDDWSTSGGKSVATYEFDVAAGSDAEFKLSLVAADMAGNTASYPATGADSIVIDKKDPVISSVKYYKNETEISANADGTYYSNEAITAKVTVNEKYLDKTATAALITVDGTTPTGLTWDDSDADSGIYVASFTLNANAQQSFSVSAQAADRAGNKSGTVTGTAVVDRIKPQLVVSLPDAVSVENVSSALEVNHYAGSGAENDVTAEVYVSDKYVNANDITINVSPAAKSITLDDSDKENLKWTIVFAAPAEGEAVEYSVSVSGKDKAANLLMAGDSDTFVDANGIYRTTVVIDDKAPVLSVEWDNNDVRNGFYYKATRKATITVDEEYFDPSRIEVDGAATTAANWTTSGTVHTYTVDKSYAEGQNHTLTVKGTDFSDNPLVGGDNAPAGKNHHDADSSGKYDTGRFVVDLTAPVVTFTMSQARTNVFPENDPSNSVDYYRLGDKLNVDVSVEETNFDPKNDADSNTVITPGGTITDAYDKAKWSGSTYALTFTPNDAYEVAAYNTLAATVYDLAGNATTFTYGDVANDKVGKTIANGEPISGSKRFALDIHAPSIAQGNGGNIPDRGIDNNYADTLIFYKNATTLGIVVTDGLGIENITGEGSNYTFTSVDGSAGGKQWSMEIGLRNGVEFTDAFVLTATDVAHNVHTWKINPATLEVDDISTAPENTPIYSTLPNLYPKALILDTTPPDLSLTDLGNETYYNSPQTVTLGITELNFRYLVQYAGTQNVLYTDAEAGGNGAPQSPTAQASDMTAVDAMAGIYTYSTTFSADGHYVVHAQVTDPAGNSSSRQTGRFTIDQTAPTATISWDNNNARNGMYYNAARTATITITEHNFLASDFTIETTGSIGGWSSSGDTHTCIVSFATDGRYTLSVSGHDRAGNQMNTVTEPEFVIDLTAPTIDFSNVTAQTAYNGEIAPVINYHDEANFDTNGMTWTLTGNKHGGQTYSASQGSSGNDGTVTFADFPRQVEVDDIYTLQAHLTDMAGNEADNSITFSVNRFGSNFIILDEKTFTEHKGYLAEPVEIRVQEINVSGALNDEHGVSVTHGLSTENLDRKASGTPTSEGFYIESGSDNAGWASYTYHIGSGNFEDDGNYHVVISSTDTATNLNNSASYYDPDEHAVADAEVSFILDTADPMIDGISVIDGRTYDSGADKLTFTVTDNIGFDEVKVVVDGDEQTVEPEMGGLCTVDLPAKAFTPRDMQIVATDLAGRTAEAEVLGFHWTDNFVELHLPIVIGGAIVIVAAVVGGVLFVRRRNNQ